MAVTSLWHVKGSIKDVIDYIENPEKAVPNQDMQDFFDVFFYVKYRFAGNYLPILYKNCRLSSLHPKKKEQIKRRDFCTLLAPFLDV